MRALSVALERPNATTNAPSADFVLQLEAIVGSPADAGSPTDTASADVSVGACEEAGCPPTVLLSRAMWFRASPSIR